MQANWQVTDQHKIAVVVADRQTNETARQEFDGVAADLFWTSCPTEENQTSFELRLESDWSDSVRSTFGVYYWDGDYTHQQKADPVNIINPLLAGTSDGAPSDNISHAASPLFNQSVESQAIFGQVDWDVMAQLMLSLGGRWLDEEQEACMTITGYSRSLLKTVLGLPDGPVA